MSRYFANIVMTVAKECGADLLNVTPSVAYVHMTGGGGWNRCHGEGRYHSQLPDIISDHRTISDA